MRMLDRPCEGNRRRPPKTVVRDFEPEVGKENIRVTLQSDGHWKVEYSQGQPLPRISGSFSSPGIYSGPLSR